MNQISYRLFSPAKINLSLRITSRDPKSGYHLLESFMKKINLQDEILIRENKNLNTYEINFSYGEWFFEFSKSNKSNDDNEFPEKIDQKNNLISKAIKFFEKYSEKKVFGLQIHCHKNIPYGSGLGGGSSNAASILKFLQKHYKHHFDQKFLQEKISLEVGSDVLFFLNDCKQNEILFLQGIGGDFESVKTNFSFENFGVLIFYPYKKFDTKEMYKKFSEKNKFDEISNIDSNNFDFSSYNAFYSILENIERKEIDYFLKETKSYPGLISSGLSGSGSACFAVFQNQIFCENAKKEFFKKTDKFLEIYKFI
jgi:4-diphosphocytidyl-2-C-methyl-D-erythritol kinase